MATPALAQTTTEIPLKAPISPVVESLGSNCYLYASAKVGQLPRMLDLQGNSQYPRVGGLVILYYPLKHLAIVEKVLADGIWIKESNYIPGEITERFLTWEYLGEHGAEYWHPIV